MTTFKVGEVCILQNAERRHDLNGQEALIVQAGVFGLSEAGRVCDAYVVRLPDGEEVTAARFQLRKRRPPAADESHQAMLDCIERAKRGQEVEA